MPRNAAMWNPICAPKSPLGAIRVEIQANRRVKRGGTSKKHEENGKMVTMLSYYVTMKMLWNFLNRWGQDSGHVS